MTVFHAFMVIFGMLTGYLFIAAACYWRATAFYWRAMAAVGRRDDDVADRFEAAGDRWYGRGERLTFGLLSHGGKR